MCTAPREGGAEDAPTFALALRDGECADAEEAEVDPVSHRCGDSVRVPCCGGCRELADDPGRGVVVDCASPDDAEYEIGEQKGPRCA